MSTSPANAASGRQGWAGGRVVAKVSFDLIIKEQKNASSSIRYWRYYQANLAVAHNARNAARAAHRSHVRSQH